MNLADLSVILITLATALTAGLSAGSEKAGWSTVLFVVVVVGLGVGFGLGVLTRQMEYLILAVACRQKRAFISFGFLLLYMLVPMLILVFAIHGTGVATAWVVKHLL